MTSDHNFSKQPLNEDFFHAKVTSLSMILACFSLKIWPLNEDLRKNLPQNLTGFLKKYSISWKWMFLIPYKVLSPDSHSIQKINPYPPFYGHVVLYLTAPPKKIYPWTLSRIPSNFVKRLTCWELLKSAVKLCLTHTWHCSYWCKWVHIITGQLQVLTPETFKSGEVMPILTFITIF